MNFNNKYFPDQEELKKLMKFSDNQSEAYEKDKENLLNDEKKLLYVAMTRAKKTLTFIVPGLTGVLRNDLPQFVINDFNEEFYNVEKYI